MKKWFIISIFTLSFFYISATCVTVQAKMDASEYADSLGNGYNLSNTYEVDYEQQSLKEENVQRTICKNIAEEGYKSIRIPITWYEHWDETSGKISESFLSEIGSFVRVAREEGLQVILTMYDDSWEWISNSENIPETLKLYAVIWKQIGNYFSDYEEYLSFEGLNEPFFENKTYEQQLNLVNQLHDTFVTAVRETGGKNAERVLLVSTLRSSIEEDSCKSLASFMIKRKDPYLLASVHYYGMWEFSVNAGGVTTCSAKVLEHMRTSFTNITKYFTNNGFGVVCTEFGLYGDTKETNAINHGQAIIYYENLLGTAKTANISMLLWDSGKYYNRIKNIWYDDTLAELLKKSSKERSSYATTDSLYFKKNEDRKQIKIPVVIHGANLTKVLLDDRVLEEGKEYRFEDSHLILYESVWETLDHSKIGMIGKLIIQFSKGCDWMIGVYQYEPTIFESEQGSIDNFKLHVQFFGDKLVAMEAKNGVNDSVGPLKSSTFQEFGYSFLPDYTEQTIHLTEEFLQSLEEKETVDLTFYFASGETYEYTILKEGTVVKEANYVEKPTTKDPIVGNVEEENETSKEHLANAVESENLSSKNVFKQTNNGESILRTRIVVICIIGMAIFADICVITWYRRKRREASVVYLVEEPEDEDEH